MTGLDAGVELTALGNGLRVVTHQMPHLHSATLGVWAGSGSRHESESLQGISHLLEHMAFKSTRNRTTRQMAEEIEAVGGEINAATSQESTAYFARVLAADTGLAIELLADMLQNPRFDADELARERGVILQEIAAASDQPEDIVFERAESVAFAGQSLGRAILGTPQSVRRITPADLHRHMQQNYQPKNLVISAAGAIRHVDVVRHAEALFGSSNGGESPPAEPARFSGGKIVLNEAFEQHHVLIAFEGPSYFDPRYCGAQILTGILGGGASSRLFQKVREDHGLCYAIDAFGWSYMDSGIVGVHAATSSDLVEQLMTMVAAEIVDLAEQGPSTAELERAKAQIKAGLLMGLESSATRAEQMARQVLILGKPMTSQQLGDSIDDVSGSKIREIAGDIFCTSPHIWSEVGPGANGRFAKETAAALLR